MGIFAAHVTATVTIGEVVVTIRKLGWKTIERAQALQATRALAIAGRLAPALLAELARADRLTTGTSTDADVAADLYDARTVLRAGVQSWTADRTLPAGLDDLTESAERTLVSAILSISTRTRRGAAPEGVEIFADRQDTLATGVTIRVLSARHLREAREAQTHAVVVAIRAMPAAQQLAQLRDMLAARHADPVQKFHAATVLRLGVVDRLPTVFSGDDRAELVRRIIAFSGVNTT